MAHLCLYVLICFFTLVTPVAGTGAAEATESITRSTITINSSLFDNAEAKAALVDDMLENSGIPPSGLGRRKDPSPQAQDSLPLRRTANNMLEDALQGAVTSTAGGTGKQGLQPK